jgi:hypothetical protein
MSDTSLMTTFLETSQSYIKTNIIPICVAIYLSIVVYFMSEDPKELFRAKYFYAMIIMVPILIITAFVVHKKSVLPSGGIVSTWQEYGKYVVFFVAFIAVLYFQNNIDIKFPSYIITTVSTSFTIIFFLMLIVALAIVYKVFYNYTFKMGGQTGLFFNIIFYIPCLLLDFLSYLSTEFKQTPFTVYVLVLIEIALFLAYIYLPQIIKSLMNTAVRKDGKVVLEEPLILRRKEHLMSYSSISDSKADELVNRKFAISMWVYVVPVASNTYPYNSDATIFEFGNYNPRLVYNGSTNKFKAFFNSDASKAKEFPMDLQAWNHVVFNYAKSSVDLFVNGQLMTTLNERNDNLSFDDVITIGQDNGLSGGICNIIYFKSPLFQYEIQNMYNLNKNKDPPI